MLRNHVGVCFLHFILLFREPKVLKRTLQCCALNGGVFWCSLYVFECGLLPLLKYLLTVLFGHSSSTGKSLWSWIKLFLSWTFGAFWVLPLFLLSKIVNSLWFQVIMISCSSLYLYSVGGFILIITNHTVIYWWKWNFATLHTVRHWRIAYLTNSDVS